ncbi:BTB/POZ domain-containing protein 1 isoform X1 [Oryctolagus cuniculus]|uniref:BTB/POZ domain-containing protein 1 isoform X1 n=1 Tax=Oryctolagus cuniculus TaxID=9986 RepID=UPI0022313A27|nr:BTB/POZ domain-containing protein 1 isoform X1 [Oryctolagus cuniculus]XP_062062308.1 BTB/POZ domain-containing protein 1 isoform X1 [Lepus europaeus]
MASLGQAGAGDQAPESEAEPGAAGPPPSPTPLGPLIPLQREPLYNWQATKASLKERFAFLFNSELLSDVRFVLGKGRGGAAAGGPQRIPAHRFVLAAGSAVFDAMFNGGMATTSAEIELPDVEPAAFLALLRFLYSDEVQIGPETVMTTLYTAKKYAVPALEAHCVEFLTKHLRADNAFMLLTQIQGERGSTRFHPLVHSPNDRNSRGAEMNSRSPKLVAGIQFSEPSPLPPKARLFDEPQLASLCLDTIDKSTMDAISAEGFTDIDIDTLCAVLERDTLSIRESRLFGAVVRWAEAECQRQQLPVTFGNKQKVLGKALSLIRFPLMTIEEFAAGPAQSGILSDREVVNLFLHFTVNPKPRVEYTDRPRCCLRGKECCINRFQQVESRWGYSGTSDRIRFTVNRRISIVGFGLYGSIHGPTDYQVNIQIIEYEKKQTLGQNDTGFSCDGTANTFRVMFKEPIEILPNVCYTACATLKGPDSHYGTKGLKKVVHETPAASKTVFLFFSSPGNNNGTSIEDGQIPEIIFYT